MDIVKALSIAIPTLALCIGIVTLRINTSINRKNRNVRNVMQLTKDFYQDSQFTVDRLRMWESLKRIPDEEHNYIKLVAIVSNDKTSEMKKEDVVALSRTAAFYNSIKGLIESGEADIKMLQMFFGYNYTRFWNPTRKKLETHSTEYDKNFFKPIPELLIEIETK